MRRNRAIEFIALHAECNGQVKTVQKPERTSLRCGGCGSVLQLDNGECRGAIGEFVSLGEQMLRLLDCPSDYPFLSDDAVDLETLKLVYQRNPRLSRFMESIVATHERPITRH